MFKRPEKATNLLLGNYRGIVVDVDDPKGAGRVKVRVMPHFRNAEDSALPWATYADPLMGGMSDTGGVFVPPVDSMVWCFFEGGDWRYPVYFAGAPSMSNGTAHIPSDSPKKRVYKSPSGFTLTIDDENSIYKLEHPDGTYTEVTSDSMTIDIQGDKTVNMTGNCTYNVSGDTTIDVSGNCNIKGTKINLN